jgi:CBS domain-containing protein
MVDATLTRSGLSARCLMTANPVSISEYATLREAGTVLTTRGISAAPVIDDAGRAVGVLSRTDIVRYTSGNPSARQVLPEFYDAVDPLTTEDARNFAQETQVWQIMTPVVLSVKADASLAHVVAELLVRKVHRLFVTDNDGTLIGVISALDVLSGMIR